MTPHWGWNGPNPPLEFLYYQGVFELYKLWEFLLVGERRLSELHPENESCIHEL